MAPVTVKYLGGIHPLQVISRDEDGEVREPDVYRGWDNDADQSVVFEAGGAAVQVGPAMAERLAEEFPGCFEIDGQKSGKKSSKKKAKAEPNADEIRAQLLARDRDELNAVAGELGIENPADVESVEELVDAIVAKHAEQ